MTISKKERISPTQAKSRELIDPTAWMVPYGNLMTILLIFFLVLYSYAYMSNPKYEKALQRIKKELSRELVNKPEDTEIAEKLQKELERFGTVLISARKIKIDLPAPILFASSRAELKPEAIEVLQKIGNVLKDSPNKIIVEGHTDNVPIAGGKYSSNWELSAARAFSVINYFVKDIGIKPERLTAYGYGEFRPVVPNDSEENRAKNRRIEITILRE